MDRPILFSAPMVRAILAGTKVQTRRVLRDQDPIDLGASMYGAHLSRRPVFDKVAQRVIGHRTAPVLCPYGKPGDRLWVREAWAWSGDLAVPERERLAAGEVWFRADHERGSPAIRWRPSIHMPRWASRITLEVTGVRVERLQAISEADSIAEGIEERPVSETDSRWVNYLRPNGDKAYATCGDPRDSYRTLWESINGPGSWAANPWVWVVEFKRVA